QARGLAEWQAALGEIVPQRYAGHVIRNDDRQVVERGHFMNGDDVGVAELGRGAGLALKSLVVARLAKQPGVRNLEGDDAIQARVPRLPDGPERPDAQPLQELEAPQRLHGAGGVGVAGLAQMERAAAARTKDVRGLAVRQVNRVVAMG